MNKDLLFIQTVTTIQIHFNRIILMWLLVLIVKNLVKD